MDFSKIVIIAIFAVITISLIKQIKSEFAIALSVGVSVVLMLMLFDELFNVVQTFYNLSDKAQIDSGIFSIVIKVVGIGYLAEFTNNVCVDANCKSVGDKVILASKIAILLCALPIVENLFELLFSLNL
ncbi:MAG: hypothetical protein IJZ28_00970 [Clostridia bacterium]|nr:hypothetical protein [Clostridia bacterium]MBQ7914963.1 hypothetical protein [Clostridia bacterium]MBQ8771751.1 hypothetical protein [Clostridia bacterium]MBQ8872855.1 hypothetical protein [Clostridia bacterium]